jgi:gluconolactonase
MKANPEKVDALECAFLANQVSADLLFATGQGIAPWMASITFGGRDLRRVCIGSLKAHAFPLSAHRSRVCPWFIGTDRPAGSLV